MLPSKPTRSKSTISKSTLKNRYTINRYLLSRSIHSKPQQLNTNHHQHNHSLLRTSIHNYHPKHNIINNKQQHYQFSVSTSSPAISALDEIFTHTKSRTYRQFIPTKHPLSSEIFKRAYDIIKYGPTSYNSTPLRIAVLTTSESKEKFVQTLPIGNATNVQNAPLTCILAYDLNFPIYFDTQYIPTNDNEHNIILQQRIEHKKLVFIQQPEQIENVAKLNSILQAGYYITTLRGLGMDVNPASGFDPIETDNLFFTNHKDTKYHSWRSFMYINIGIGDSTTLYPREPRLDWDTIHLDV